ncbi:microfibril-associated glycoprotein 4-like isoform X2 [Lytechinus pictus]|uniref:microfibril-associated glycoprotein 4-like isoform X2 n=1 Tax=Lytechinus pictus TaxID=7653 RepID=UPI0030BA184D
MAQVMLVYFAIQLVGARTTGSDGLCSAAPELMTCPSITIRDTGELIQLTHKIFRTSHPISGKRTNNFVCRLPECRGNPCFHGGTCIEEASGYRCVCPEFTTGTHCEQNATVTPCACNPCLHGGSCVEESRGYSCLCPGGTTGSNCESRFSECDDLFTAGYLQSGVYDICVMVSDGSLCTPVPVYCDMDSYGWTLIQRRFDGSVNFNRTWADYKTGFGNVSAEFWLGNDVIHHMTKSGTSTLRVVLELDGNGLHAVYKRFSVADEKSGYQLSFVRYSGSAGDAMRPLDGLRFSTLDWDQDLSNRTNCALKYGGFWYAECDNVKLNVHPSKRGLAEWTVDGNLTSFTSVHMKIRTG